MPNHDMPYDQLGIAVGSITNYLGKLPRFEKKGRVALDWTLDLLFSAASETVTTASR